MRDPARIDRLLEKVGTLWHRHPDQRLCQLMVNITAERSNDSFYVEDADFERRLDRELARKP